jgi:hypothetical protein
MLDPLTLLMVGAGALAFREMNKKDYGVLTPSRDERYRNVMQSVHDPLVLLQEAKTFAENGLKVQAAMLRKRAEWRMRPPNLKKEHEDIYQRALKSSNIAAILDVARGFEEWTATRKAATLRERAQILQQTMLQDAAKRAEESVRTAAHANGNAIPQNENLETNVTGEAAEDSV